VTSNPQSALARRAQIAIVPVTGPEIIAGSTRMKAALAQKMVLHMISTAVMIRLGHVYRNYMVGVLPTNRKLVARACGIISTVTGADSKTAARALKQSGNNVKVAIAMLQLGLTRASAAKLLKQHAGNLRAIC
jgi:N-acetylmuramic acid 6-phosphate etherase